MAFFVAGAILVTGAVSTYSKMKSAKKARKQTERAALKQEQRIASEKREESRQKKQTAMRMQKRRGAAGAGKDRTRSTILTGALGVQARRAGQKRLIGE